MISIVAPAYNEEDGLEALYRRVTAAARQWDGEDYEFIIVDDGSRDRTPELCEMLAERDPRVKIITLSRNFGHQPAITAGLDHATGDIVAVIDADLQDPPEVLGELIARVRGGMDVVYAIRINRKENVFKRLGYHVYYRLLRRMATLDIPLDAGDFCVMSRRVVDALCRLPERSRFLRGLRTWVGFRQQGVAVERQARFAGAPKYTLRKLVKLALDGVVNFSYRPLQLSILLGLIIGAGSILLALIVLAQYLLDWTIVGFNPRQARGWTSLMLVMLFSSAAQLFCIGVLGEYVGRLFEESKRRPVYVVARRINVCARRDDA
jgi:dolichol-phosphate mannosyltransferase